MKNRKLITVLSLLAFIGASDCFAQNTDRYLKEAHEVFNTLLKEEGNNKLAVRAETFYLQKDTGSKEHDKKDTIVVGRHGYLDNNIGDDILSAQEKDNLYGQVGSLGIVRIEPELLDGNKVVTIEELREIFGNSKTLKKSYNSLEKKYGADGIAEFGTPVFDGDFTTAVVRMYRVRKPGVGFGHFYVLKKENGSWKVIHEVPVLIS